MSGPRLDSPAPAADRASSFGARELASVALAVAVRPELWRIAVVMVFRLAEPGWWRRAPYLPLPPAEYLRFRLLTNYGSPPAVGGDADARRGSGDLGRDVVAYLRWCRGAGRSGFDQGRAAHVAPTSADSATGR